ncbi:MAG: cytidine deaminase [Nocardioidaceae bacterium]
MAPVISDPEDSKLVTLARAARARAGFGDGAAVRDTDGRTYAAASVDLPSLQLSALQVVVAMAATSGVGGLEAAVLVTESLAVPATDTGAVRDLGGAGTPIYRVDLAGELAETVTV